MKFLPALAVINRDQTRTAVWHVDIGPPLPPLSRLCGAWVTQTDQGVPHGVHGRLVFASEECSITDLTAAAKGVIQIPQTLANIDAWIQRHSRIHARSRTPKGNERAPINWPTFPQPLDWKALPAPPRGVIDDKLIADTIVASLWIARLAEIWSSVETLRLSRSHLRSRNPTQQDLPFAIVTADSTSTINSRTRRITKNTRNRSRQRTPIGP